MMEIVEKRLSELKHPEQNVRMHSQKQIKEYCRSISSSVIFSMVSSSRLRITYPLAADLRTISIGSSRIGAKRGRALLGVSSHFSRPKAR